MNSIKEVIEKAWVKSTNGSPLQKLFCKLKHVKQSPRDWNIDHVGNIFVFSRS